ncbi:hypothetical protein NYP18_03550 [Corynebacterium sp. YIM 101645]|uniref:DNA helicase DnaB-like N-terminal domain-containing protein n=1 Tax=Corynebacterium lemuris TaxID=1859292 RepID=A0ABT2FU26_9CORY|nr:hypothetical protein [Corynebacterium lemuris]MCS5478724.1 hypothetical protein [Corynebacterium lemuris]
MDIETPFLRVLLTLPARRVLGILDGLEPHDVHRPQHRVILTAVARCARKQVDDGDDHHPVSFPVAVQLDLSRTGDLDHPHVRELLLDLAAGINPVPECWVVDIVADLRRLRLRRACVAAGEALVQAGRHGGDSDLTGALRHLPALLAVAIRAGLTVEEDQ